ncbi:MAG: demethoxyubiquinone hydroxylase family protein [Acetobacteraceae bacterium]
MIPDDRLPGDPSAEAEVARMIRVDHAGEYGAARIYAGQLAVLGRGPSGDVLRHMQEQEKRHLAAFEDLIAQRRVRPTALLPFWHLAGFALGAATAALGERAAMACTAAVEETIDAHYARQSASLAEREPALRDTIEAFRAEELEHRDIALAHGAEQALGYRLLAGAIKAGCRVAIRASEIL